MHIDNSQPSCERQKQPCSIARTAGFTILELMIASTVFAVILLVVAVGVISFTDNYYKGITAANTQSVARTIMADVSQSIEFGGNVHVLQLSSAGLGGLCVDNTLYSYQLGQLVTNSNHGLVETNGVTCSATTQPSLAINANSRELLNQNMQLATPLVLPTDLSNPYAIRVRVIYGADNLLTIPNPNWVTQGASEECEGVTGSQFCAVSDLMTTVDQRL
jgi:prepilin-type N-terminal cleavage/methylation domain-containing protein